MCDNLDNLDRDLIREQRAVRRKMKKEEKRQKKEKERELKTLALKFGSKDTHITLVTREFVNSLSTSAPENKTNTDINQDEFPCLGENLEIKNKRNSNLANDQNVTCYGNVADARVQIVASDSKNVTKKSKSPIVLDIKDIIKSDSQDVINAKQNKIVPYNDKINANNGKTNVYNGNMLDSSRPIRQRGKHRETPKSKKPNTLKAAIIKEQLKNEKCLFPLEIFCDNIISDELNDSVSMFLSEVVNFQEKLYKRDPLKGVSKRRYVVGFHEVKKYLKVGKIRLIIFAPNLNITDENSVLVQTINNLKMLANVHDSYYLFALSRKKLGRLCLKTVPVSCVGILNYSGAEDSYKQVFTLSEMAKEEYQMTQVKEENKSVIDELSDKLLNVLKT